MPTKTTVYSPTITACPIPSENATSAALTVGIIAVSKRTKHATMKPHGGDGCKFTSH